MEELQLLVQEEGRAAKHAAFSVSVEPLLSPQSDSEQVSSVMLHPFSVKPPLKKPPATPRQESKRDDHSSTSRPKRLSESAAQGSRLRSASTGRDKRSELQNFHWTILRGTLVRTMEEIFYLCEQSESIDNCKVMMLMMENYVRDFKSLIQYLNVKWGYENTPPPERPTSIAWEVRRSSPTKCFLALRALRRNEKPEEIRACLVDYLAQELMLSQAIGLSPSDIANAASQTANCESVKNNMVGAEETKPELKQLEPEPSVDIKVENTEVEKNKDFEVLATPLEDSDLCQENVVVSDPPLISNTEATSVSSQTDPCNVDEVNENVSQDISDTINEPDIVVKEKKEESCQTDAIPLENYVLDISELEKEKATDTTSVAAAPAEIPAIVKPRTPSRLIVTRPSMAAAVVRGIARPTISRGRGMSTDVRPSAVQPRAVRSLTEIRGGLSGRGLARKSLEPRLRSATTGSTVPTKQPTTRIAQTLATLPNKPNIGVGRGVKKLPERVSKSGPVIRTGGLSHREIEGDCFLGDQRSNSSSSINSSSSRSSWADKVKGSNSALVLAATIEVHSVEDLLHRKAEAAPREEDGWRMVKARSRSKISPVTSKCEPILTRSTTNIKVDQENKVSLRIFAQNRFHQPSAARSLPTLALNIPQQTKESVQKCRPSSSKAETSQSHKKPSLSVKPLTKIVLKCETKTAVKSPSSPDIQSEKNLKRSPSKLSKQNTSNEKLECEKKESHDDSNKSIIKKENNKNSNISQKKIITNLKKDEIMKNMKNDKPELAKLELEINAPEAIKSEVTSPVAQSEKGDSDREEEEQRKFDDEMQRKTEELCAEEKRLEKQIEALQTEVELENNHTDLDVGPELSEKLHAKYRYMADRNELPPYDPTDVIEQMRELEIGHPGRALELHQKLSSPSRRRTPAESVKSLQTKQAKAQEKRAQMMQEKWLKIQELDKKIEEVRAAKLQNIEIKREQLELKLRRAEQKRNRHLQEIARKAHDEEEKLKEIAFINELEAQNKRHDFMALCQEQEERLQGIQEERQRKQEEKAAKEAAVEERKKVLAAEREAKLKDMQEKRRQKEERIGRELQEKEKERMELAREKARDREERLQAIQAAQLANQEELQKKIQAKQEEYARRHDENIEQIRQRALECCLLKTDVAPRLAPYDTHKLCTLCNVLIGSDVYLVSHLRGRQHQEAVKAQLGGKDLTREEIEGFSLKHITDAPASDTDNKLAMDRERQKALKKRCKKIRLRMAAKGQEYENSREIQTKLNSPQKPRIQKCLRDVERLLGAQGRGLWSDASITSLERALAEIGRILDKKNPQDQGVFLSLGGFNYLLELFNLAMDTVPGAQLYIPAKCFVTVCNAYQLACASCVDNCSYVILSNKISTIMDLLLHRLACTTPTRRNGSSISPLSSCCSLNVDNVSGALMRLLAMLLEQAVQQLQKGGSEEQQQLMPRVQDVVSYAVSAGVLEKLAACCGSVRDPIDDDPSGAVYLLAALRLLRALVACARAGGSAAVRQDVSQLGATLRVTELVGGVSMLYGMLLHQGAPPRGSLVAPPPLPPHTIAVAKATLTLLREVAEMDLALFQGVLGAEGMSLQFRHLTSHLLWACSGGGEHSDDLLQEVIRVVGFFAVRNHDNQMTIQSGFTPTVLQQFCNLPFAYFSEERLACVLLPTLLACCWDNAETRAVLEQELSFQLLEDFRLSKAGQKESLVALLGASSTSS